MMMRTWMCVLVAGMLAAGGCSSQPKENPLASQNTALLQQLQMARADAGAARAQAADLQRQLAQARAQAATRPTGLEGMAGVSTGTNARGEQTIRIEGDVLFDSGSARIKPQFEPTLERIAQVLTAQYAGDQLRVEGYTDARPILHSRWKDNWDLGAGRARAVALYLMDHGVPREQVYIASFADNQPRSTTDLQQNRRVEIVVLPPLTPAAGG